MIRIDHEFNEQELTLFGHLFPSRVGQGFTTTMWSSDNVPTIGSSFGNPSYSAVVHLSTIDQSHGCSTRVAFNYNGNRINIASDRFVHATQWVHVPRLFTGLNDLDRIPRFNLSGSTRHELPIANWIPWKNNADSYQFADDVS